MKIEINIQNRHVLIMLLFIIAASGIGLVVAYGGTTPTITGHSWEEINCPGCITNSNLADNSVTGTKIQDGAITSADVSTIDGSKITGTVPSAGNADTVDGLHAAGIASWGSPCNPVWEAVCSCCSYSSYTRYCYYMGRELAVGGTSICLSTPSSQGSCGSQYCGADYGCCY